MVRGGFRCVDGEGANKHKYKYSNADIAKICKTQTASVFCETQHLKYIVHVA